jgi:ADP-ribosylglycohydrolase
MPIPKDYLQRVYAGVLGKIIGVYLGRPFEGWSHETILRELGEINYYVHEKRGVPLIVSDDDISGTFTFVRALQDNAYSADLTAAQIGRTWLNYIIENKTILWWGGMGMSTEHTAYLRLKAGISAPQSGAIATNGKVVAEQIGSQIFIDGWAMVAPGDPDLAVALAKKAASVSHDGEAIHGAVVIAAIESMAFFEKDLNKLLDAAVRYIPSDSIIYQLIADLRRCRTDEPDWHKGLALIHEKYSYEKFGGGCHMVPNHAVIMLGLLWGDDDFQRSLMITNTAGYDTDCNSANVGCILGIKNGLTGIDTGPDWRGPVADRILMPTADGGRCVTDAVIETYHLARAGMALAGHALTPPKSNARFHFSLPGSVQGFTAEESFDSRGTLRIENVPAPESDGSRCLALQYHHLAVGCYARASTPTFCSVEQTKMGGYAVLASPTVYPGQTVTAVVSADPSNTIPATCTLFLRHFDEQDQLIRLRGSAVELSPSLTQLQWKVPRLDGQPIAEIGLEFSSHRPCGGTAYLHSLTWDGTPDVVLKKPESGGSMWTSAWVDGIQQRVPWLPGTLVQNTGRGLLIQGTREWAGYRVATDITPHMVKAAGLAACVRGMQRYYALLLCSNKTVKLVKMLDGETVLSEKPLDWEFGQTVALAMAVDHHRVQGWVNDQLIFDVEDNDRPLVSGAVAIVCEEGRCRNGPVTVSPIRK